MMPETRRASAVVIVVLAGACSGPSVTDQGFISIGRDSESGASGFAGTGGFPKVPSTGGVLATGGTSGDTGTAGTFISQGGTVIGGGSSGPNGGTSTGSEGGTAGDANGGTSTGGEGGEGDQGGTGAGASGGTAGDANGGTSTGGEGNTCGSGGLPTGAGGLLFETCEGLRPGQRFCLPDDSVAYCGQNVVDHLEQCEPGTCATGCCHATSDPCPIGGSDCAGDCGGDGICLEDPRVLIELEPNALRVVRVGGANTGELQCGDGTLRTFGISLEFPQITTGPARVTVSPPWRVSEGITCGSPFGQCAVINGPYMGFAVVSADVDSPPPRNVIIETSDLGVSCP
jgi:hypothetical protein